jgi:hypothetical protein
MMHSDWRCDACGPVLPLHVAEHIGPEIIEMVRGKILAHGPDRDPLPMWCPWPLMAGWTVTGVGWAGDDRAGVRATVVACSGPSPLHSGPADLLLVAEDPGVGLGSRFAGLPGTDPGPFLDGELNAAPHAQVRTAGWMTPLWSVKSPDDRCAHVGEAMGRWVYLIAWPAGAGYLLAERLELCDLTTAVPAELVYGAPSPYLHGSA